jgi:putative tryptophan/tyrosine transport system substrate-binding protein
MKRRQFIAGLGAAAWPVVTRAQQQPMPTIGWLHYELLDAARDFMPAFHEGLAQTGHVEGRNVTMNTAGRRGTTIACPR